MTNQMQLQELMQAAQHAAQQSDRYLFLLVLAVFGAAVFWAFRWLVGQYTSQTKSLAEVIERNSAALHASTEASVAMTAEINYCRARNSHT